VRPSEAVRSVLELSGLQMLIASETVASTTNDDAGKKLASPSAAYELFAIGSGGMKIEVVGDPAMLERGLGTAQPATRRFDSSTVALGIGALGANFAENASRCGEMLAVAGVAAFQPADGASQPDFMLSEGALVPEGHLVLGLSAQGTFSSLLRFEAPHRHHGADADGFGVQRRECGCGGRCHRDRRPRRRDAAPVTDDQRHRRALRLPADP
jgi:hypothetical protein